VVVSWLALVLAVELRFVALVVDAGTGGERDLAAAAEEEDEDEDEEDEADDVKEEAEAAKD
jgi:hypothetical protein